MASVRERPQKDGSVSYAVLWRDPQTRKQTSMTVQTADEAALIKRMLDANGQSFTAVEDILKATASTAPTVATMLSRHLELLTKPGDGTIAGYQSMIDNHLLKPLGALRVDQVREDHLAAWMKAQIASGATRKSIANRYGLLSSAFKMAVRKEWRPDNPCEYVALPNERRAGRRATFLTRPEYDILLAHIPERHQTLVKTLAGTGMRFSEATALTWDDLKLDAKVPVIEVNKAWKGDKNRRFEIGSTKNTPSDRDVSIAPTLADELRALEQKHEYVFPSLTGGQLTNTTFHQHGWQDAVREAKGNKAFRKTPRPHDLRHSHASWLIQEGVPIYVVSRRLGHISVTTTTQVYGHLLPQALKDAADAIERVLG